MKTPLKNALYAFFSVSKLFFSLWKGVNQSVTCTIGVLPSPRPPSHLGF
jgi:hypothetical protein